MIRSLVIAVALGLTGLYGFARYARRSSMFFPEKFPSGAWETAQFAIRPEEHVIRTNDGVNLHAWLFRARAENVPLLIYFHGNAGNLTGRAPVAEKLALRGVSVLLFDWRGYGRSESHPTESGLYRDALAAYDYAKEGLGATDIVLYGESLGGPYAGYVAARREVRCVIIENSFPSLRELGNHLYFPFPLGWTAPFALSTTRWLNEAGVPVLVMHGRQDEVIPFALGKSLYDGLRVRKQMLVSEHAGHCALAEAEGERFYEAVTRFINVIPSREDGEESGRGNRAASQIPR